MDYQSCICKKCGHVYLPSPTTRFCSFCGAEVPKYEEKQEITCPCCQGRGKIKTSESVFVRPMFFNTVNNKDNK